MPINDQTICGLDEAGRGALAGPLIAAAVLLPVAANQILSQIKHSYKDSKKMTSHAREIVYHEIINSHIKFVTAQISAKTINEKGIGWSNIQIFRKLIQQIHADTYIVDGNLKLGNFPKISNNSIKSLPHADSFIPSVILAGIIAKVTRDRIMITLNTKYSQYGFVNHKGYGTLKHIQALTHYGLSPVHRIQFVTTALTKSSIGIH